MALMFLQFTLETLEQGEGIGGGASETGNHPLFIEGPDLAGITLHDGVAKGYLTITADHDLALPADRQNGCSS